MSESRKPQSVKRIVLPNGRSIEVVQFGETPLETRPLHICPACCSPLVQPVAWVEVAEGRWEITLECPNCWWSTEDVFDREQVRQLEDELDDGLAQLLDDLKRLSRANMADQVERFVTALDAGQILPEDF